MSQAEPDAERASDGQYDIARVVDELNAAFIDVDRATNGDEILTKEKWNRAALALDRAASLLQDIDESHLD